jgi:hypothetical protein
MSDDKFDVQFGASTQGIEAGADRTKEKIREVSSEVEKAEELFKYLGERMAEVFALHEITEFVGHMAELGEQALRSAAMLGMTVEQVQELGYAAQLAGTDSESFNQSMIRFERNIAEAQKGAGNAAEAFHNLGISQQDLANKSPSELLYKVADAFRDSADGANKVDYAISLGSRSWAQMIPLLDRGGDALRQAGEDAKQTASVMNNEQAEALEHTHQEIVRMEATWRGFGLTLMGVIGPAVDGLINGLAAVAKVLTDTITILREMSVYLGAELIIAVGRFLQAVQDLGAEVGMVIDKMMIRWRELGAVMTAVATGNWSLLNDIYAESDAQSEAAGKKAVAAVQAQGAAYEKLKTDTVAAMNQIIAKQFEANHAAEGSKPALPALQGGFGKKDNTERQLAEEDIRFKEQMGRLEVANRKTILDEKVALGEISKKQEYEQLQQLALDEYNTEWKALVDATQIDGLTVVEKQKLYDQLALLHQKYENQKELLTRKALDDEKKQYDQVFQGINRAFTQSINGILQGTQTWQQATANIFTGILSVFVDMAEKMVAKWIEAQVMQAVFGKEEAATTIATDAATAGAAAYASTAAIPVVGPELAPAAAAAAYADTMAFQGLASFDVGSWELPGDQVARVHKGEMIIPKPFADSMRENGGGLGGGDTFHIHAVDAQSFVNLLKNNSAAITGIVKTGTRNFSSDLRPSS